MVGFAQASCDRYGNSDFSLELVLVPDHAVSRHVRLIAILNILSVVLPMVPLKFRVTVFDPGIPGPFGTRGWMVAYEISVWY